MKTQALLSRSNWHALGDRFSGESLEWGLDDAASALMAVGVFALGFWLLARLAKWQDERPKERSPRHLAAELAQAHGLSWLERMTMRSTAKQLELAEVTELYIRPDHRQALADHDAELATRVFGPEPDQGENR